MNIRHTIVFTLKHPTGSEEEEKFLEDIQVLANIPGVRNFSRMRQISRKNEYDFAVSMEFLSSEAFQEYTEHPCHTAFMEQRWEPEVKASMEIDTIAYP